MYVKDRVGGITEFMGFCSFGDRSFLYFLKELVIWMLIGGGADKEKIQEEGIGIFIEGCSPMGKKA